MSPLQILLVSMRALWRNKLRSFLTTLGIIIGVGAVITMMAIGAGAKAQVEATFAAMGTNLLILLPGSASTSGVRGGFSSGQTITWDDFAAIRDEVATVKHAAPSLRSNQTIISDEVNWLTSVTGTTPDFFDIRSWPVASGASFTQADIDVGAKVIILGQTVSEKLFGLNADPVGQSVRVGTTPFTVIGVASKKGQSGSGQDYDDAAFIPDTTFAQKIQGGLNKYLSGQIYIEATSSDTVDRASTDITALLRQRHHLKDGDDNDFSIRNLSEMQDSRQQSADTMTALLASVAAVSLLVGGIGIMNIMLVSVTERTREIGVRMALGAKPHNVLAQFLAEALVLSMLGGAIGVAIGVGTAQWVAVKFGWPTLVQPQVIAMSFAFSAFVGIVFGSYPARKASQLDPIEALRYE